MYSYDWAVSYDNATFEKPSNGWAGVRVDDVLALLVYQESDPTKQFVVRCGNGVRPIFYWTVQKRVKSQAVNGELEVTGSEETRITVFGWQKTVNGSNVKSLIRIHDSDGSIVVSDHDPLQV